MIIGIDGNEANVKSRVGINTYAFELLWSLHKLQDEWGKKHKLIVYLKNEAISDMPPETNVYEYKILKSKKLWILTQLTPRVIFNPDKLDLLFTPTHYVPPISLVNLACAIMDLGYLKFSEQFKRSDYWQLKLWSAYSILISKCIISISEFTKKDIIRHYANAKDKVVVTLLGYDSHRFVPVVNKKNIRHIKEKYSIVNDYILFISTLKPSKNVEGLIKAFAIISKDFPETSLVIAGKKGWLFETIFEEVKKHNLTDRVVFTDFVLESEKPDLIRGAKLLALPSFWEGFGIDVLEAMGSGVPVVASNVASLPEVVGNAGILVDPYNPANIADGLAKVLNMNQKEYNRMVDRGIAQAKKFSWERTARETLKAFESI